MRTPRHARFVRITHWLTTIAVFALLFSGVELVLSHPRFYWGEVGNVNTTPIFSIPVPSSRGTVPTGYGLCCRTRTGGAATCTSRRPGSRSSTGLVYLIAALRTGHFGATSCPPQGIARGVRCAQTSRSICDLRRRHSAIPGRTTPCSGLSYLVDRLRAVSARRLDGARDGARVHRGASV